MAGDFAGGGEPIVAVIGGVSGTGKTTVATAVAARTGWPMLEGDALHPKANIDKMSRGQPLDDDDRAPWLHAIADWIAEREAAGESAVVACSALKRAYRDLLRAGHGSVRFIVLAASREVLAQRMSERSSHFMPVSLLDSQLATYQPLEPDEPGGTVSVDQPPAAVIDDVLALLGRGQPTPAPTRLPMP